MTNTLRNKANPYFAKANHHKAAKRRVSKTYVDYDGIREDLGLPPTITWHIDLTIGHDGTIYGYRNGVMGAYQWLDETMMHNVEVIGSGSSSFETFEMLAGAQLLGLPYLDIVFSDFGSYHVARYNWVDFRYVVADGLLRTYFVANENNTVQLSILNLPETIRLGPFTDGPSGITFWIAGRTLTDAVIGFNIDRDEEPDIWALLANRPTGIPRAAWDRMKGKAIEAFQ